MTDARKRADEARKDVNIYFRASVVEALHEYIQAEIATHLETFRADVDTRIGEAAMFDRMGRATTRMAQQHHLA